MLKSRDGTFMLFVSIPFKREGGYKVLVATNGAGKVEIVSIPFKREGGYKESGHYTLDDNGYKKFQFPSNGKVDTKSPNRCGISSVTTEVSIPFKREGGYKGNTIP